MNANESPASQPAAREVRGRLRRWLLGAAALLCLLAAGLTWELERNQMLETGTKAPDFDLTDGLGRRVRLADFAGKPLILYFYPADFTPT